MRSQVASRSWLYRWMVCLVCIAPVTADATHLLSVRDTQNVTEFGRSELSRDYTTAAVEEIRPLGAARKPVFMPIFRNDSRVFLFSTDGRSRREVATRRAVTVSLFSGGHSWSPDSRFVITQIGMKDGKLHLAIVARDTGRVTVLSGQPPSGDGDFAWLPDDRLLYPTTGGRIYATVSAAAVSDAVIHRWHETWAGSTAQVTVSSANEQVDPSNVEPGRIMVADPKAGSAVQAARGDFVSLRVSPDGRRVAAICLPSRALTRFVTGASPGINHAGGDLCVFRIHGTHLIEESRTTGYIVATAGICWSKNGDALLVAARRDTDDPFDPGVYVYNAIDRSFSAIRPPLGYTYRDFGFERFGMFPLPFGWIDGMPAIVLAHPSTLRAHPEGVPKRSLEYGEYAGYRFDVWSFSPQGPKNLTAFSRESVMTFRTLRSGGADVESDGTNWRISPDRQPEHLVPRDLPRLAVVRDENDVATLRFEDPERSTALETLNAFLHDVRSGQRVRFFYQFGGGRQTGWLVSPPGFEPGRRYPTLMLVYGGSVFGSTPPDSARLDERYPFVNAQIWAAHGFVVICPSLPLAGGSAGDQPRILADGAVAALLAAAQSGMVDLTKVAVLGHSFGGFSALSILANAPGWFKAGVVESGAFYDPVHAWGALDVFAGLGSKQAGAPLETFGSAAFVEGGQSQLKSPPWVDPDAYIREGPLFHAAKIKAPVMLIHGDLDDFDTFEDAQRMFAALVRTGNKAVFVHYWGEGHGIASPANQRDEVQRVQAWLELNLHVPNSSGP